MGMSLNILGFVCGLNFKFFFFREELIKYYDEFSCEMEYREFCV